MRRTRGLVSGLLLVLLGAWAGLAPFIAPYGGFGITPATPWHFDAGRLYFSVLPGAVVLVAGLIVAAARLRPLAVASALVAALAGIWLGYGVTLTRALFPFRVSAAMLAHGTVIGATPARMLLSAGALYYAPGMLTIFLAAIAIGRISVVSHKDHLRHAAALAAMAAAGGYPAAGIGGGLLPGADQAAPRTDAVTGDQVDDYEQYGAIYERFGDDQVILSTEDESFPRIDPAAADADPTDESSDPSSADPDSTEADAGDADAGAGAGDASQGTPTPLGVTRPRSGPLPPTGPDLGAEPEPDGGADPDPGARLADAESLTASGRADGL